ncbi:MAG: A24 family peptidase [Bacillota bacterium]|nr:A24 family peptidase [Bacillota bacterium]
MKIALTQWILMIILAIAFVTDVKWRKIYNWSLMPGVVFGLGYHGYTAGLPGLVESGQGLLLGIGLLFIPYALGGLGAGDVKLLGTVGALMGSYFVWQAFLFTALMGGLLALGYLIYYKALAKTIKRIGVAIYVGFLTKFKLNTMGNLEETAISNTFPYGIAIVGGTLFTLLMR